MLITLVKSECAHKYAFSTGKSDVMFFADTGDIINYRSELKGTTEKLLSIGKLSKTTGAVVIGGYVTDNYGIVKRSCVVADKGAILGISDMKSCEDGTYSVGFGYKIYYTKAGKFGVIIGEDFIDGEGVKILSELDVDVIFAVDVQCKKSMTIPLMQSLSYMYGVSIVGIKDGLITVTDGGGGIVKHTDEDVTVDLNVIKKYREVRLKKRGLR